MPKLTMVVYEYSSYEEYEKHKRELESAGYYMSSYQEKYDRAMRLIIEARYLRAGGILYTLKSFTHPKTTRKVMKDINNLREEDEQCQSS